MKFFAFAMLLSAAVLASCAIETPEGSENADDMRAAGDVRPADTSSTPPRTRADGSTTAERTMPLRADTSASRGSLQGSSMSLYPVDEGDQDPSFFAFRMRLLDVVVRRDVGALFESIDEDVRISFGPGGGHTLATGEARREEARRQTLRKLVGGAGIVSEV